MKSTLTILHHIKAPMRRCLNEVIVLLPLAESNIVNINGNLHTFKHGLIINHGDLYQHVQTNYLLSLSIPLASFIERDALFSHSYLDYNLIRSKTKLHQWLTYYLKTKFIDKTIDTSMVSDVITLLLAEAQIKLQQPYLPVCNVTSKLLKNILVFINNHITEPLLAKILAQRFYISQSYISILFSTHLQMQFKPYITSLKIKQALIDLLTGQHNIHDLALNYSFSNVSTFSKQFKKYIQLPPKKFFYYYKYHNNMDQDSLTISPISHQICLSLHNYMYNITTPKSYTLELQHNYPTMYFKPPQTIIKLANFHEFLKFTHTQLDYFDLSYLPNPILYIEHIEHSIFNTIDKAYFIKLLQQLKSYNCSLLLPVNSLFMFNKMNDSFLVELKNDSLCREYLSTIQLLFNPQLLPLNKIRVLKNLISRKYAAVNCGLLVDDFFQTTDVTHNHIVAHLNALPMDFYIINMDLTMLAQQLAKIYNIDSTNIKNIIAYFLDDLEEHAHKLIFIHLTYNALQQYYSPTTKITHAHLVDFIVSLSSRIRGLGFPLYCDNHNKLMLMTVHENYLPIMHIYQMLAPFMNCHVCLHNMGLFRKQHQNYELLVHNGDLINSDSETSTALNINHHFHTTFSVFSKLLNDSFGSIDYLLPSAKQMQNLQLDTFIIKQINQSNHPQSQYKLFSVHEPLTFSLQSNALLYLILAPTK